MLTKARIDKAMSNGSLPRRLYRPICELIAAYKKKAKQIVKIKKILASTKAELNESQMLEYLSSIRRVFWDDD